jgi:hypothetical protein
MQERRGPTCPRPPPPQPPTHRLRTMIHQPPVPTCLPPPSPPPTALSPSDAWRPLSPSSEGASRPPRAESGHCLQAVRALESGRGGEVGGGGGIWGRPPHTLKHSNSITVPGTPLPHPWLPPCAPAATQLPPSFSPSFSRALPCMTAVLMLLDRALMAPAATGHPGVGGGGVSEGDWGHTGSGALAALTATAAAQPARPAQPPSAKSKPHRRYAGTTSRHAALHA